MSTKDVREWMTRDPVVTSGDVPLGEALAVMIRHRVRHLPVLTPEGLQGLLSSDTLVQAMAVNTSIDPDLAATPCASLARWIEPLDPEADLATAAARLQEHDCLPVMQGGKLVGLFSQHNLLSSLSLQLTPGRVVRRGATPAPHRLDSLVGLMRRVSRADTPQAVLASVVNSLQPLMPVDQAFVLLDAGDGESLQVVASFMGPAAEAGVPGNIPLRDTLSGYVCLQGRPLRIDDLATERRFPQSHNMLHFEPDAPRLRSVMAVPLLDQHVSFGVLQFWSTRPFTYLESDLELLELAAGSVAATLQRARRLEVERQLVTELQKANRIKDEFLAVVTHDLRNTLQGVLSYSQLLSRKVTEPRLAMLAKGIVDSAKHMSTLTNDLHDYARLGMEAMRVDPQTCSVAFAVDQVREEFAEFASTEKVELRPALVDEALTCRADPVRLRQVLSNLLSNAVKYNRPDGWVEVRASARDGGVAIEVEDSGIGIPAADQPTIFDLFSRAANHKRVDSSGLGLAISKRLVELHGGELQLHSVVDQGTRFTVFLPDA